MNSNIVKTSRKMVDKFFKNLNYKSNKKNTIEVYSRVLGEYLTFIEIQVQINTIEEVDRFFIISFLEYLENKSRVNVYEPATKALYLSILKSFFNFMAEQDKSNLDFTHVFKKIFPKKTKNISKLKYLKEKEKEPFLRYINTAKNGKNYYSYIYAFGIKLMLFGGLRISEVLNLKIENFEEVEADGHLLWKILLKNTKSNTDQYAFIKKSDIADEFFHFKAIKQPGEYIFTDSKGSLITRNNFYRSIKTKFQHTGINKSGLHIFRHTCAMEIYRSSGDIMVTKSKLRHSDIKTTMIYADAEHSDVVRATIRVSKI